MTLGRVWACVGRENIDWFLSKYRELAMEFKSMTGFLRFLILVARTVVEDPEAREAAAAALRRRGNTEAARLLEKAGSH